jgi:putative membrane protein
MKSNKTMNLVIAAATVFSFIATASAQSLSSQDKKFMEDAAKGGQMEVSMGQVAMEKGKSDAVKTFGQRMVTDHGKGNRELMGLAQKKGVVLPNDDSTMKSKAVSVTSGGVFDKAYAKAMVSDHEEDIKAFEKEAASGSDPDVKKWANETLPTLRMHLDMAKALDK